MAGGRPTKRSPEMIEELLALLSSGLTKMESAVVVGITPSTFHRWAKHDDRLRSVIDNSYCWDGSFSNNKIILDWNRRRQKTRQSIYVNCGKERTRLRVQNLITYVLKIAKDKTNSKLFEYLGCDYNQLMQRLESTIPRGFIWEDYMDGTLQIDHIKPVKDFDFYDTNCDGFKECFSLTNMRLLHIRDNVSGGFDG